MIWIIGERQLLWRYNRGNLKSVADMYGRKRNNAKGRYVYFVRVI